MRLFLDTCLSNNSSKGTFFAGLLQVPGNFHVSTHSARKQPEEPNMSHIVHKVRFGMELEEGKVKPTN